MEKAKMASTEYHDSFSVLIDSDLKDLIPNFLNGRKEDVKKIGNLLEDGDFKTIQTIGHTLKGNGSGYGFDGISDIGKELELAAIDQDSNRILQYTDTLQSYLKYVRIAYK